MDRKIKFFMIGGFLGAGKTTSIARIAQHYVDQGLKVAIVTNDQAYDLVDTQHLRSKGFEVGEVPGACFCCKFDDLVETANSLSEQNTPDIIIAEPVGSCTDLMATVVEPLRQLYGDRFETGPLTALLKPEHGRKILRSESNVGFSPKAAYIFLKQIEEADIVAINKIDKLSDEQQQELVELINARFPEKKTLCVSARDGQNFDQLISAIEATTADFARKTLEIDYDIYAEGEAELGWFNCQVKIDSPQKFSLDEIVLDLTRVVSEHLLNANCEPVHLKLMGQKGVDAAVANWVESTSEVELSLQSEINVDEAELIINARIATDPEALESIIKSAKDEFQQKHSLNVELTGIQCFKPGRPVPTHRMSVES